MDSVSNLRIGGNLKKELGWLIRSVADYDLFMRDFWNGEDRAVFAISSFRLHKIKQRGISYKDFVETYSIDKKRALESLFFHAVNDQDVKMLEAVLVNEDDLRDLFDYHKKNPRKNLMSYISIKWS